MTSEAGNRLTIIGAGVLAIIVFAGLSIRHNVPLIEQELSERVTTELRNAKMSWAKVNISGRDLTLSGVAPDEAMREAALLKAFVRGVRKVDSQLETVVEYVSEGATSPGNKPAEPADTPKKLAMAKTGTRFRTRLTVTDSRLILDGAVPGERQRQELVELAQAKFGVATVEARLQHADNPPEDWLRAIALGVEIADLLVLGEVNLVDQSLHVMGITATTEGKESISRLLEQVPAGYAATADTGARAELDAVLRTTPALAQRLARRTGAPGRVEMPSPQVLSEPACASVFRDTLGDRRILFSTASATLTPDSMMLLDELATVLKRCSGVRVAIHGHTDDQGRMDNNLSLSQRRAESVMQHFVSRGISLGRLTAQGFGEEQPLVPNETAADRAVNRRIEFEFESR